jgi:hypothetical protein
MDEGSPGALNERSATGQATPVCRYLVSVGGPWRSAEPTRDHRCSRLADDIRLDLDHQRRFCLGSGGPGCPHFVEPRAPGRFVSVLPVVMDRGPLGTLEQPAMRRLAAPATVVVVGAALGALLLARGPGAGGPPTGGPPRSSVSPPPPAPSPMLPSVASPSAAVTPAPSEVPQPSPVAPSPAAVQSPSATPISGRTYTVRRGDTLVAIAARFGTTTQVLVQLNGITNPGLIRVGQVLQLP